MDFYDYSWLEELLSAEKSRAFERIMERYSGNANIATGVQNLGEGLFGKVGNISNEYKERLCKHYKQLEEVKSFSPPKEIIDELYLEDGRSFEEVLNDTKKPVKSGWIDATTLIKDTSLLNIK